MKILFKKKILATGVCLHMAHLGDQASLSEVRRHTRHTHSRLTIGFHSIRIKLALFYTLYVNNSKYRFNLLLTYDGYIIDLSYLNIILTHTLGTSELSE
jgi:hypothetical protein